jgi:alkane 1-monooxygenase
MRWTDLKYLTAYLIPFSAFYSVYTGEWWSYLTPVLAFLIVPLLELRQTQTVDLDDKNETDRKNNSLFFDFLLYLNVPIVYGIIALFIYQNLNVQRDIFELIGMVFSVGIVLGSNGINVAHELGHRVNRLSQLAASALLLPSFYMHFTIEHNLGHHKNVATPSDPASAPKNMSVYEFWWVSVTGSFISALNIERYLLKKKGIGPNSIQNRVLLFALIEAVYMALLLFFLPWWVTLLVIASGFIGFLQLETINYIEHYGLRRKKLPNDKYERVRPVHSWNSNHWLGRVMLYELTRHSDHHYRASKKYQILEHKEEAPQLPVGYPAAMMMALIPPLWFRVMEVIRGREGV